MRHIPIAEFQDRASEIVAAAEAGEEIAITRNGREVVRLVAVEREAEEHRLARQREAVEALSAIGRRIRERRGPTTAAEIREWIDEGRR